MADVVPTSVDEYIGLVKATAPKYFKKASDLTFRRRLWLQMLLKHGMVEYNASSHSCTWPVEYSQPELKQYGDSGDLEFNEHDALQQLTVDVRGYTATDRLTLKQKLMNMGGEQIDDLYRNKSKRLLKRVRQGLCAELYVDGNAANNGNRLMGIETFMADDGNTVAADRVANPSDSYAGQTVALGAAGGGGSWSSDLGTSPNATIGTDWPLGKGTTEYDYIAPLLANISSSSWAGNSTAWIDNCEEILRYVQIAQILRGAFDDDSTVPFLHMLSGNLYNDFLNFYSTRNRQAVPHAEAANLGFHNTMNLDGSMVHYEFDVTADVGYGICPNQMELFVMHEQLIVPVGPEWQMTKMGYLYLAYIFGNLRFQPKFFAKYKKYA